jgi:hypothetical protein
VTTESTDPLPRIWLAVVHRMVDGGSTRRRITLARPPTSSANRRSSSLSASTVPEPLLVTIDIADTSFR